MKVNQTGIFYANVSGQAATASFPKEYRRRLLAAVDRPFALLLAISALVLGGFALGLSMRDIPEEASREEVLKIQERYARLVLNQPKPKEKEKPKQVEQTQEEAAPEEEEQEKPEVDRKNETFAERQERRRQTQSSRRERREQIEKEVQSAGIFAAITSAGSAGGFSAGSASDLLGAADAVGDLGDVDVKGGGFAVRAAGDGELKARRGKRTTNVDIQKESVGRARSKRIASAGQVNVSSAPAEISGDEGQASTNKACIQTVINREKRRIKRVYENWIKRDPELGGRLKFKFTILPSGAVSNVIIISSTTGNSRFDQNILRYITRWDFSQCDVGAPLAIELPFAFEGQK